jgi:hypothetical protein
LKEHGVQAPIPGYGVQRLEWDLPITPGGPKMTFHGTVQNVTAHLSKLNPNWMEDFNISTTTNSASAVEKRELRDFNVNCNRPFGWEPADQQRILQGIDYLRGLNMNDHPQNGPGPGNCGRVSCSFKSAIWWCNDVSFA